MKAETFAVVAAPLVSLLIFFGTLAWQMVRERHKPKLDEKQVETIVRKNNRWRDARLAQYDRYFDEQDLPWHRAVTKLLQQAKDAGFLPDDAVIPSAPVLPDPPAYD